MTTTPYAKTTMKIDGAPAVSGAQLVGGGNVVQLLGESTVNWNNQLWQIYEYPTGFALPAGWTNNNGIYECSLVVPPTFTIDPRATRWGKYLTRLVVNNGLLAGVYAGPGAEQPLVDVSSALETKSPNLSLTDVAFMETNQFDPIRQWVGELKATLRALDNAVGAGVATSPGGTNGQVQYNAAGSFAGLPVLKWDAPTSRVMASSGGLGISNPGGTFGYSITGSAITADRILTLPLLTANDTVVTQAFAQALTNKTLVAANNTITDTGAAIGDLLYFDGTHFVRFARGTAGQVLTADAATITWQSATLNPSIIWRAGVASATNHVATWAEVETFITANSGKCIVYIDDSVAACVVPNTANTECSGYTQFIAYEEVYGNTLTIADGGRVRNIGLLDNVFVQGAPTTVEPLIFDVVGGGTLEMRNYATVKNLVGAAVAMMSVQVASQFFLSGGAYLVNSLVPSVPIVDVGATFTLGLLFSVTGLSTATLNGNLVKGAVTSTLNITHDATLIFAPQALFLGTVTETRSDTLAAIQPSEGTTAARPAHPFVGEMYFDTTLDKPIWWTGSAWILASPTIPTFPHRSSAVTTTLVSGVDCRLSMTAPGQIAYLPATPTDGEMFSVKAAYTTAGNTTIQAASGPNTVEGAATFAIGPRNSATLVYNATTTDWEDV